MALVINYPSFWLSPNAHKGYLFEQWVVNQFPEENFKLREWRSDKRVGNRSADSGKNPDLIFECSNQRPNTFFAVECKFRTAVPKDRMKWAKPYQLENYNEFRKKYNIPVFVAIGLGGDAHQPLHTAIIPLENLRKSIYVALAIIEKHKTRDFPAFLNCFIPIKQPATSKRKADVLPIFLRKAK